MKLDDNGQYLPFYGYTTLVMLQHPEDVGIRIENFIRNSSLTEYFSPLPHESYHMTIFNVYTTTKGPLIPPVQRWLEKDSTVAIPAEGWLPDEVLAKQNEDASAILSELPASVSGIKDMTFRSSVDGHKLAVLKLNLSLHDDYHQKMMDVRQRLSAVYETADSIFPGFHITLAYGYRNFEPSVANTEKIQNDLETLNEMVKPLINAKLTDPGVYMFDSMTNFMLVQSKS